MPKRPRKSVAKPAAKPTAKFWVPPSTPAKGGGTQRAAEKPSAKPAAKPTAKFWVPPSTPAKGGGTQRAAEKPSAKPAAKFWTRPAADAQQEHNVDGLTWSSVEEIRVWPELPPIAVVWYGRPIIGAAGTYDGHRALARLPGAIGRDDVGGSRCSTCEFHNLGDPHTCPVARKMLQLLHDRTGFTPDDHEPF